MRKGKSVYTEAQLDQIDRLVAVEVMKWQRVQLTGWSHREGWRAPDDAPDSGWQCSLDFWRPTRDRGQAMMVFERCEWMTVKHDEREYAAGEFDPDWEYWKLVEYAPTPQLAICPAALKKTGVQLPQPEGQDEQAATE